MSTTQNPASWPDRRALDLLGIERPIIQAPMAGSGTPELAIAVCEAGGLGSLACAQYSVDQAREAVQTIRAATSKPFNLNFFCHRTPQFDAQQHAAWVAQLEPYYRELGLEASTIRPAAGRAPFDAAYCELVESLRPAVVSFHFGLPEPTLLARVKASGARVLSSATTVAEARWLAARGCDAIIAMGSEAGGHRGSFLSQDMSTQVGTFALVPQIVDAVDVPVIAAGGIADGRGVAAALLLGASAAQIGTAYLFCPEVKLSPLYRAALENVNDDGTALTNLFTGRPARGAMNRLMRERGPLSNYVPRFPLAGAALAPLRAEAERKGHDDFTNLWSGQAAPIARRYPRPAAALTRCLAEEALKLLCQGMRVGAESGG